MTFTVYLKDGSKQKFESKNLATAETHCDKKFPTWTDIIEERKNVTTN